MDSGDLERERGITILAKNTSVGLATSGRAAGDQDQHRRHAGPLRLRRRGRTHAAAWPTARCFWSTPPRGRCRRRASCCASAWSAAFPVIVVINKIDRQDARPDEVAVRSLRSVLRSRGERSPDRLPDAVRGRAARNRPPQSVGSEQRSGPTVRNDRRAHSGARGRPGGAAPGDRLQPHPRRLRGPARGRARGRGRAAHRRSGRSDRRERCSARVARSKRCSASKGCARVAIEEATAGDVIAIAGLEDVGIGDTIAALSAPVALPRIRVEEPTIKLRFSVNTSPLAGRAKNQPFPHQPPSARAARTRGAAQHRIARRADRKPRHFPGVTAAASSGWRSWPKPCAAKATRCSFRIPRS